MHVSCYLNFASFLIFLEEHACLNYTVQYNVVYYPRTENQIIYVKCSVFSISKGFFPAHADQVIEGSLTLTELACFGLREGDRITQNMLNAMLERNLSSQCSITVSQHKSKTSVVVSIGNSMICTTSDISKLLYVISWAVRRVEF